MYSKMNSDYSALFGHSITLPLEYSFIVGYALIPYLALKTLFSSTLTSATVYPQSDNRFASSMQTGFIYWLFVQN